MRITVVGGGSWATAIVKILSEQNVRIKWWMRNVKAIEHIRKHKHNPQYLSSVEIHPAKVKTYIHLKEALKDTDWVVLAVPSAYLEEALSGLNSSDFKNKRVISAVKGMIPEKHLLVSDFLVKHYGVPLNMQGVIGGPCHAEEVALERSSYLTIASPDLQLSTLLSEAMDCRYIRCSTSDDIYGVEYAAVIKNIVAIASGIAHGLGKGDNFQAVLVANAMQEMKRFVSVMDNITERDMMGSAYLGDLLVTAYSQHSRNRTFGNMLGRGYSVKNAQLEMKMVAEGYFAVKSLYHIMVQKGIHLPITHFVYKVVYDNVPVKKAFEELKTELY